MEKSKGLMGEFKEFISKGNVIDLAVGVIIGGAFTAIVTSLVNDILMPIIGLILGGMDFSTLSFGIGGAQVMYGAFIQAVINFLIIAFVIFMIVKGINSMKRKEEEAPAEPEAPAADIQLLTEIRDLLKK
ncbi:MAG: large-conductance mechanosensitive channel protein MscL [Peptostreptococcaceae bacterium]|nr:large-conductance mechanosensitive channel protein MscL [Peptostreptococcaceae bacterium]MDY5739809.1 large-conductance mechanosensitive channel protein MscL [Anaerovoracaceae bacterium]SFE50722.1 large conductance mechanosensitive channel [Peptostreptococcaceae bacterium pGA-8]